MGRFHHSYAGALGNRAYPSVIWHRDVDGIADDVCGFEAGQGVLGTCTLIRIVVIVFVVIVIADFVALAICTSITVCYIMTLSPTAIACTIRL